jgi:uncharacterized protein Veg
MHSKIVLLSPILGSLCGCSSFVTAIFDRPQIRDEIDTAHGKVVILTMTGDRRLTTTHNGVVCGESYPDVATAYSALSQANASASKQGVSESGSFSDEFQTTLLQTFNRTETADAIRQIGWQICQAYSNSAITQPEYYKLLDSLVTRSFNSIDKHASAPPVATTGRVSSPPATLGTTHPVTPGTAPPVTPGTAPPATLGTTHPATPGTTPPATPGTEK